jgi:hypothetical protein
MRCHAIVLDCSLNDYSTVLSNIYIMYLIAAMRIHCYLKILNNTNKIRRRKYNNINKNSNNKDKNKENNKNSKFLCKCIDEGILFGARLIHTRTKNKISKPLYFNNDDDDL